MGDGDDDRGGGGKYCGDDYAKNADGRNRVQYNNDDHGRIRRCCRRVNDDDNRDQGREEGRTIMLRRECHRRQTHPASRGASTGRAPNNVVIIGMTEVWDPLTWVVN